jgi:dihydropteroate synthase
MQFNPEYEDVMYEIKNFLKLRTSYAISCGIKKENIIVDPGIGFGKRTGKGIEDNCEIIKRLGELKELGFPILVGASRKTFIGNISGGKKPLQLSERLEGSLAATVAATINGANIIRTHDVRETRRCLDVVDCIIR